MSPTTEHLRARLAAELDDLGPMPDLAPVAERAGSRILRRRRLAVGSVLGVAAVGGGSLATQGGSERGGNMAETPSASPSVDPLADGRVTDDEWHETVRGTLESVLPERYGATSIAPEDPNRAQTFTTSGGDPRLQLFVAVQGRPRGEGANDQVVSGCAALGEARPLLSCAEAELADGWFAVATTERTGPTGDGGAAAYGTALTFLNEGVMLQVYAEELDWDGIEPNDPANLTAEELIDMAETPEFLEMTRVGVQWARDLPERELLYNGPDPVWPTP